MIERLKRIVENDFLLMHAATIINGFGELIRPSFLKCQEEKVYRFFVSRQAWQNYSAGFPGYRSGKYTIVDNLPFLFTFTIEESSSGDKPQLYTAPSITADEIQKVVELALSHLAEKKVPLKNLWEIKDFEEKLLVITLSSIDIFLKKKDFSASFEMLPRRDDLLLAPFGGIFYRREHKGEPVLAEEGGIVLAGSGTCVIEMSKVFSLILAEKSVKILEVLAEDGKEVKESQPLFRVEIIQEDY